MRARKIDANRACNFSRPEYLKKKKQPDNDHTQHVVEKLFPESFFKYQN